MSFIGSLGSLFNAFGRLFWGIFCDKTKSFEISMGLHSLINTIFIVSFPFIKYVVDADNDTIVLFAIWNCILWSCLGCQYGLLPSFIASLFDNKYTV